MILFAISTLIALIAYLSKITMKIRLLSTLLALTFLVLLNAQSVPKQVKLLDNYIEHG